MALETGNYINDLVITNPTSNDPKSAGDDHLRLLKKTLKETLNGFTGAILVTATDTGNATAHVLTPSTALIGYTPMLCLLYLPAITNTGAVTVNVSGLGAKSIKTMYGANPTSGDIIANVPMLLMYNGTNFLLLAGAGFMGLTGSQTLTGNLTITGSESVSGTSNLTTVVISGSATAPTLTVNDNSTKISTTAFVTTAVANEAALRVAADALLAPLASPSLTGTPISTTATTGTNTTQIATCAFVMSQAFSLVLPAQSGNAGKFVTTDGTNASWATLTIPTVPDFLILNLGII